MEARYEELFTLVASEIRRSGFEDFIIAGIVLTGGASKVDGALNWQSACFDARSIRHASICHRIFKYDE